MPKKNIVMGLLLLSGKTLLLKFKESPAHTRTIKDRICSGLSQARHKNIVTRHIIHLSIL